MVHNNWRLARKLYKNWSWLLRIHMRMHEPRESKWYKLTWQVMKGKQNKAHPPSCLYDWSLQAYCIICCLSTVCDLSLGTQLKVLGGKLYSLKQGIKEKRKGVSSSYSYASPARQDCRQIESNCTVRHLSHVLTPTKTNEVWGLYTPSCNS